MRLLDCFPFLTNLRTESRVPGGPQNCLPVRTAAGGGHQEPTPHTFYNLCKHLTGKKPAGDAGGGSILEQPAAGPRPPPKAWRSPANGWGAAQDCGFRGSRVRLLHFFFSDNSAWRRLAGIAVLKYFTKTFGWRDCSANCIAKIFPGLRKLGWGKGSSPNAQVLPLR